MPKYPVDAGEKRLPTSSTQADEIGRPTVKIINHEDRTQLQTARGRQHAVIRSLAVDARRVKLNYQNLKSVQVNYYLMDIELLFSRNPFVQGDSKQFAKHPAEPDGDGQAARRANRFSNSRCRKNCSTAMCWSRSSAPDKRNRRPYYSNALRVQSRRKLRPALRHARQRRSPLAKVYVKVYARMKDGTVQFYKDGYTDLRGCFDYSSLSTNELDFVDKFLDPGIERRLRRPSARSEPAKTVECPTLSVLVRNRKPETALPQGRMVFVERTFQAAPAAFEQPVDGRRTERPAVARSFGVAVVITAPFGDESCAGDHKPTRRHALL